VIELGAVPYRLLHHLYTAADIYVTPAYTETFAHPLVEAMASGLPIVASDIAVHREICGDGAVFFDRFSAERLSEEVLRLARSDSAKRRLAEQGGERLNDFSWHSHVSQLVSLSEELLRAARPT
jgi:glycosyltransferase involved in cell wall biosynthesis